MLVRFVVTKDNHMFFRLERNPNSLQKLLLSATTFLATNSILCLCPDGAIPCNVTELLHQSDSCAWFHYTGHSFHWTSV